MPRIGLFGASPDTYNMGVSALFAATISGIREFIPDAEFTVFDMARGIRQQLMEVGFDDPVSCRMVGARGGKRFYRPENLSNLSFFARLGSFGASLNPVLREIDACDVILDMSGGDSFSDIYGMARFDSVVKPKEIALLRNKPLILLPQTYGPYKSATARQQAQAVIRGASLAMARDANSYKILKDMLGDSFNDNQHQVGVDVAFQLIPKKPVQMAGSKALSWIDERENDTPLVGININGLVFNDPVRARNDFGFIIDYARTVKDFLDRLLNESNARVLLVPHVMAPVGHYESDMAAIETVIQDLTDEQQKRVTVTPLDLNQCEVKWVISKCDWFCGTRMHATIAGLSTGVPTATISYSDKSKGVFATCDLEHTVFDPRKLDADIIVDGLIERFLARETDRRQLSVALTNVKETARKQMKTISDKIM